MVTLPNIEFVKGIRSDPEHDTFFDINKRTLMVIDDQIEDAGGDKKSCLLEALIIATSASFISYRTYYMEGKTVEASILTVITWLSAISDPSLANVS